MNISARTKWIICYDISNDRTRRTIFETLKNHAHAVQYSVFEANLNKQQQAALKASLNQNIESGDSIRWYPLCQWCKGKMIRLGCSEHQENTDYFIV